jgi:hypothetical protein
MHLPTYQTGFHLGDVELAYPPAHLGGREEAADATTAGRCENSYLADCGSLAWSLLFGPASSEPSTRRGVRRASRPRSCQ